MLHNYENSDWEYVRVKDALENGFNMSAALLDISSQALIQDDGGLQDFFFILPA